MNIEIVILSGASRSFIARGGVEGPAVCSWRQCFTVFPAILSCRLESSVDTA